MQPASGILGLSGKENRYVPAWPNDREPFSATPSASTLCSCGPSASGISLSRTGCSYSDLSCTAQAKCPPYNCDNGPRQRALRPCTKEQTEVELIPSNTNVGCKPPKSNGRCPTAAEPRCCSSKPAQMPVHFPGHHFLGPGTKDFSATPVDEDDRIAKVHDLAYLNSKTKEDVRKADEEAIAAFMKDVKETSNWHSVVAAAGLKIKYTLESATGVVYPPGLKGEHWMAGGTTARSPMCADPGCHCRAYETRQRFPIHFPGHHFLGPGTKDFSATPVDEDDRIAKVHDLAYLNAKTQEDIRKADEEAIASFNKDAKETWNWHSLVAATALKIKYNLESATGVVYPPGLKGEHWGASGNLSREPIPCPPSCSGSDSNSSSSSSGSSSSCSSSSSSTSSSSSSTSISPPQNPLKSCNYNYEFCTCEAQLPSAYVPKPPVRKPKFVGPKAGIWCGSPCCAVAEYFPTNANNVVLSPLNVKLNDTSNLVPPGTCCYRNDQFIFQMPDKGKKGDGDKMPSYSVGPDERPLGIKMIRPEEHPQCDPNHNTFLVTITKTDDRGKPAKMQLAIKIPRLPDESVVETERTAQYDEMDLRGNKTSKSTSRASRASRGGKKSIKRSITTKKTFTTKRSFTSKKSTLSKPGKPKKLTLKK